MDFRSAADMNRIAAEANVKLDMEARKRIDEMIADIVEQCYFCAKKGLYELRMGQSQFHEYDSHAVKFVISRLEEAGYKVEVRTEKRISEDLWIVSWESVSEEG